MLIWIALKWFLIRFTIALLVVCIFIVLTQDLQVFPGLYSSKIFGIKSIPTGDVEVLHAVAGDGASVTLWRRQAGKNNRREVALIFHGNAENLASIQDDQRWIADLGITNYAIEYRGYNGRGSGWPSEKGFYLDASAAIESILKREKIDAEQLIIIGKSIGTGPAAWAAREYSAGVLVLLAPYSGLRQLVSEMPLLGYLSRFLRYDFPTKTYVQSLGRTNLVLAHGAQDQTIPFHHSEELERSYKGSGKVRFIRSDIAGHNDLLFHTAKDVGREILAFLTAKNPSAAGQ